MRGYLWDGVCQSRGQRQPRAKDIAELQMKPIKRLACGIIAQAVDDLRLMGKKPGRRRVAGSLVRNSERKELERFFGPGGGMGFLISTMELELNAEMIREKLKKEGAL